MDEPGVLISLPDLPGIVTVPGCIEHKCTFCPRMLAISPGGQPLLAKGVLPICPVCMMVHAKPEDKAEGPIVTDEIRAEVEARGTTPEEILGRIKAPDAISKLADRVIKIEGMIERGEISG